MADDIIDAIGEALASVLRSEVPVRSGNLRGSIRYIGDGKIESLEYGVRIIRDIADSAFDQIDIDSIIQEGFENNG